MSKQYPRCWVTMTPALRSAPTRTPRGRCREVPQKRWAISWHRSDKNFSYKKNIGEKAASSPMLFHPFRTFRQVGQGVGQSLTHTLTHNVFDIFVTKKHRKPKFSMLFVVCRQKRCRSKVLCRKGLRAFEARFSVLQFEPPASCDDG